jgi:sugar lactone lactonase YvrE
MGRFFSRTTKAVFYVGLCISIGIAYGVQRVSAGYTTSANIPASYRNIGVPGDMVVLPSGDMWYLDTQGVRMVKISPTGEILRTVGRAGTNDGEFAGEPNSITVDNEGYLYVTESMWNYTVNRVSKFDSNGGFVKSWGYLGAQDGEFSTPIVIDYDAYSNSLLVVDGGNSRIQKFTTDGVFVSKFGVVGTNPGELSGPFGVTTDAAGKIYITDGGASPRVQVFNPDYTFDFTFTDPGIEAIKDIEVLSNGNIVVTSQNSRRTILFDAQGNKITDIGGFEHPSFTTKDANDNFYVSDYTLSSIQKFDSNGNLISNYNFANSGISGGKLTGPNDLAYDSNGYLYVLNWGGSSNVQVEKYTNSGEFITTLIGPGRISVPAYNMTIRNDIIYVTGNLCVHKFALDGSDLGIIGSYGSGDGQFRETRGIVFDSQGNSYVPDAFGDRIEKFDVDGNYILQWPGAGMIATDNNDVIYVTDDTNSRIRKFDTNGNSIGEISNVSSLGYMRIVDNTIYLGRVNKVTIMDLDGNVIDEFGSYGGGVSEFSGNAGLAINPITNTLSVVDSANHRVQMFGVGVRIQNLISSNDILRTTDDFSLTSHFLDPAAPGVDNITSEMFFGNYIVSDFGVNLTTDRNWQSVNAISLPDYSKALVVNLNPQQNAAPGVSATHSLYIVKQPNQTSVFICPHATAISDISPECQDGYTINENEAGLSTVTVSGVTYWKVDNLSGTGGMSPVTLGFNLGLSSTTVNISTPITLTTNAYGPNGQTDPMYRGTVHFSSSSATAVLPANYTFTMPDQGRYVFTDQVIFTEAGDYTVTMTDMNNPGLTRTSEVIHVVDPSATPTPTPTVGPTNTPIVTTTTTLTNTPVVSTTTLTPTNTIVAVTPTPSDRACDVDPVQSKCQVDVVISNVQLTKVGDNNMKVCWDTNTISKGSVRYGVAQDSIYNLTTAIEENYSDVGHCFTLPNLTNNTKYIYRIIANSPAGKTKSYDGDFVIGVEKLPDTGVTPQECLTLKSDSYSFNSSSQVIIGYKTNADSQCYITYGNNSNRALNKTANSSGTDHTSIIDLLKVDGKTDMYYQINCTNTSTQNSDNSCKYNDVIAVSKYEPYIVPQQEAKLTALDFVVDSFSTPAKAAQTLTTTAIAGTATTAVISTLAYPQWLSYGLLWLTGRKKARSWGVVFDQSTKEALPFAVVRVQDPSGQQLKQSVTDLSGRFGFVLDAGKYILNVEKSGYTSFSESIHITRSEEVLNIDVPLSSEGGANAVLAIQKFFKKNMYLLSIILTVVGFSLTLASVMFVANIVNVLVLAIYIIQGAVIITTAPPKSWGRIYDSLTHESIKGAFVRLYDIEQGRQIDIQMADDKGRYGFIADKRDYLLKVDAQGYKFPSMSNSDELVKMENGEKFIRVSNTSSLNLEIALDPV